jgi:HD-GYP domain-containing protein (c-di-GMP phosphodiesterase class II)
MTEINEWASFHHERLDGNGYPFHHSAAQLTLGSRIMCVTDIFAALTEDRPYRKAVGRDKVISILEKRAANNGLDGRIVETLVKDYDAICETCRAEQAVYLEKQRRLAEVMGSLEAAPV